MSAICIQSYGRGRVAVVGAAIGFASFAGCGETTISAPLPAARVEAVAGAALSGPAGGVLPDPIEVRVFGSDNQPLPGATVAFSADRGGSVDPASATTDGNGISRTRWTLGNTAGPNLLTVTAGSGVSATITATATAARAAAVIAVAGDNQTAPAGAAVPVAPSVRVADAFGNRVEDVAVTFSVLSGAGRVTNGVRTTDAQGIATVGSWTLGPVPGVQTLAARVEESGVSNNPIVFAATARALFNALQFAGTWDGTWSDFTLGTTGTSHLVIAVDDVAKTVSITLSSSGPTLGNPGGAPEQTKISPYGDGGLDLHVTAAVYGDVSIRVDGDGKIDGAGTGLQSKGIDCWEIDGTVTGMQFVIDWVIYYLDDTEQRGRIVLNR